MLKFLFFSCIIWLSCTNILAQSASKSLESAKDFYDRGLIDSVISILDGEKRKTEFYTLTKEEQTDWLKLLITSYINSDQYDKAFKPIRSFLSRNPYYKPDDSDPLRFKFALDTLESLPTFMFGVRAGVSRTSVEAIGENRFVFEKNYGNKREKKFIDSYGYFVGLQFEYNIRKTFSLNFSPAFTNYRYKYESFISGDDLGNLRLHAHQSLNYLTFPLVLRGKIRYKDIKVYGQAGLFFSSLIGAKRTVGLSSGIYDNDYKTIENFAPTNQGAILGGGVLFKKKNYTYNIDFRFNKGFGNIVTRPYYYESIVMNNYDVPDDLKLTTFELSFSILYNLKYRVYEKEH